VEHSRVRKLRIEHLTEYRFAAETTLLPHRLLLRPRENHSVRIVSSTLDISALHVVRWQRDALDNSVAVVEFGAPTRTLRVASHVTLEHYDEAPLDFFVEQYAATHPFTYPAEDLVVLAPLLSPSWPDDSAQLGRWLRELSLGSARMETFSLLDQLNRRICGSLRYRAREEAGVQSPAVTLSLGTGSCRDFAALFLETCRHLGLAARFVSGYHLSHIDETGTGSTHAWVEVYLPGPGWKGFDPTAGVVTGAEHIAVAVAWHPETVPPIAGSYMGTTAAQPTMQVSVRVSAV
jgi:transglutaminase-like putative cysteine protease